MPFSTNALPALGTGLTLVTVLTASTAIGNWAPPAPPPSSGTITFTIETVAAATDLNAPYFGFFRAANIVGAQKANGDAVVEPAATPGADNIYDPTQHYVTFRWGFGDPSYTPRVAPNIPTAWRDMNIGNGRQVSHVWSAAGTYEIECIAEDEAGNFGFATLERVVTSRDTLYPTTNTICVSQTGTFTGAPTGAQQVTSIGAAMTAGNTIRQNADPALRRVRILLRAGEVFDNVFMQFGNWGTADVSLHIGTFGGADRAVLNSTVLLPDTTRLQTLSALGRRHVWENIEFRGPYRAWEEVGQAFVINTTQNNRTIMLFSRCKMDGLSEWSGEQAAGFAAVAPGMIFHDTEVTNWNNYGILLLPHRWAHLGCDIYQHVDALNGNEQGEGSQQFTQLGNRHGPFRGGGAQGYSSCSSYFSRNGWSRTSSIGATQWPAISPQAAARYDAGEASQLSSHIVRAYHMVDRCSYEGGFNVFGIGPGVGGSYANGSRNFVMDKAIIAAGYDATDNHFVGALPGMTIKNVVFLRPDQPTQVNVGPANEIYIQGNNAGLGEVRIHNVTATNLLASGRHRSTYVPVRLDFPGAAITQTNNFIQVPGRSIGDALTPFTTAPLTGFVFRQKGARWNFPAIGTAPLGALIAVTSIRETPGNPTVLQPGTVQVGEWVRVPYPDMTGKCRGALGQITRAQVEQATRFHLVSVGDQSNGQIRQRMTPASASPVGNGRVVIDYTDTHIRVQNNCGFPWSTGFFYLQLDLREHLMGFVADTDSTAIVPSVRVPASGSSLFQTGTARPRARDDLFGTIRRGSRNASGVLVAGSASQGAVEPV